MKSKLEGYPTFLEVCRNHAGVIFACSVVFPVIGVLLNGLIRDKWESEAIVQIGQVASIESPGSNLIEPIYRAIERLKSPAFKSLVIRSEELNATNLDSKKLYASTFSADALPMKLSTNTNFINLKLKAYSPEDAKTLMRAVINQLKLSHMKLLNPRVAFLNQSRAKLSDRLVVIKAELVDLESKINAKQWQCFKEGFYVEQLREKNGRLLVTEYRLQKVQEALSSFETFGTGLVEEIYVKDKSAKYEAKAILVMGALFGALFGICYALVANYFRFFGRDLKD